ncbi:HMG1/2-like protein [Hibiscus syriacus]|uniref:HMG1/2-like protein n=1 Tax=Hibiscus syriacus TaxID=106335 RepID=UPI0019209680|nr:HMG1/2-like protein [Hibiscus syriacus]
MSEEDKAPYETKAQKRKGDYEKQMKDYNKKQGTSANGVADDEDAEEANDEENEATGEDDAELRMMMMKKMKSMAGLDMK